MYICICIQIYTHAHCLGNNKARVTFTEDMPLEILTFYLGVEPKIGVSKNGWFIKMENPMNKWMIWGGLKPMFLVQHPSEAKGEIWGELEVLEDRLVFFFSCAEPSWI